MAALVADSARYANEEGTFMVNAGLIFMVNNSIRFMVRDKLTGRFPRIDPGKSTA
jgi:hypothetical protein